MRDFIMRMTDTYPVLERTPLKKAVAALFGDRMDGERVRYLFSPEPTHAVLGPWVRVRVNEGVEAPASDLCRELPVCEPQAGCSVIVSAWVATQANAVFAAPAAERRAVVRDRLGKTREALAAALDLETFDVSERFEVAVMERGRDRFGRAFGRISATGRIRSLAAVSDLMAGGLGASKAYGFGLLAMNHGEEPAHD
jgi:hypothetical protein